MFSDLIKNTWSIARRYFLESEKKWQAIINFVAIVIIIMLMVYLNYVLSLSLSTFWASLAILDYQAFITSLLATSGYIFSLTALSLLRNFLTEVLIIKWREFLTIDLINKYINSEQPAFLNFSRVQEPINAGQNIQWDTQNFTANALNLCFDFLGSSLSIFIFLYSLWKVGGTLSFVLGGIHFAIPGYLLLTSLLIGLTANFISHQIGKFISPMLNDRLNKEGELRSEIEKIHQDAEYIAQAKSSGYHLTKLSNIFSDIQTFSFSILYEKIKLNGFQFFFYSFAKLLPYVIASPLYFAKKITLHQLNQGAYAFSELSRSLSWFNNAYEDLSVLQTTSIRLENLYQLFEKQPKNNMRVVKQVENQIDIDVTEISTPSYELLLKNLKLGFKAGQHVLIKGESGLGKSIVFKIIAQNWPYSEGEIRLPAASSLMFLPQRPPLPEDELRAVLSYPEEASTYPDEAYSQTLKTVGLESFVPNLYQKKDWAKSFSGGQQQRILFARALLKKPDWLFMDESSSALDQNSEEELYRTIKQLLLDTTIISIAHRDTVAQFHDRIITLVIDKESKKVDVQDTLTLQSQHRSA
jgi:putative ATP-binding cassette transporter